MASADDIFICVFCLLLSSAEMFISLYDKQSAPRVVIWVYAIIELVSDVRQLFAADDFSRRHFHMHIFLSAFVVCRMF